MSETVIIRLPGAPRGKGRHRAQLVHRGGVARIHSHPDQKTEAYESALRLAAGAVMRGRALLTGPPLTGHHSHQYRTAQNQKTTSRCPHVNGLPSYASSFPLSSAYFWSKRAM